MTGNNGAHVEVILPAPKAIPAGAHTIERRDVALLVPYARNSRTHNDAQVAQLAASIREWGFTVPVLIDEADGIIAGHGRVLAARKLRLKDVPVIVAKGWTEAQKRAYVIADNQLALNADWDEEMLRTELAELQVGEFDLSLTGLDAKQVEKLLTPVKDDDGAPMLGAIQYRVIIECDDEMQQADLLRRFEAEGLNCKALMS